MTSALILKPLLCEAESCTFTLRTPDGEALIYIARREIGIGMPAHLRVHSQWDIALGDIRLDDKGLRFHPIVHPDRAPLEEGWETEKPQILAKEKLLLQGLLAAPEEWIELLVTEIQWQGVIPTDN